MISISSTGIQPATFEEIRDELRDQIRENVGQDLDLSSDQAMGQIVDIFADKLTEISEVVVSLASFWDPKNAEGVFLENLCELSGISRKSASYSEVSVTCVFSSAATLPANTTLASTTDPSQKWLLESAFVAPAAGSYVVTFRSELAGVVVANPGAITQIVTPVAGLVSVSNLTPGGGGLNIETDEELRLRRTQSLSRAGATTIDAIRADVLAVEGVQSIFVVENVLSVPWEGIPAKSFEVFVWDGIGQIADNDQIAQAIWETKPAGILAWGSSSGVAKDVLGQSRTVLFTRLTQVPIYVILHVQKTNAYPLDGNDLLKSFIADYINNLSQGGTVFRNAIEAKAFDIAGVLDTPACYIGTAPAPVLSSNITVGARSKATALVANIQIVTV